MAFKRTIRKFIRQRLHSFAIVGLVFAIIGSTLPFCVCVCECKTGDSCQASFCCGTGDSCCSSKAPGSGTEKETGCCGAKSQRIGKSKVGQPVVVASVNCGTDCEDCECCQDGCYCLTLPSFAVELETDVETTSADVALARLVPIYELKPALLSLVAPVATANFTCRLHALLSVWLN